MCETRCHARQLKTELIAINLDTLLETTRPAPEQRATSRFTIFIQASSSSVPNWGAAKSLRCCPVGAPVLIARGQDSAPVLSQSPNWKDIPVLGVTDGAVFVEHSYYLLCNAHKKLFNI